MFIAMVLVAAVAAAVLINTSGVLQARAQATGKQATNQVTSNMLIQGLYGARNDTTTSKIWQLKIDTELASGAQTVDITKLIIHYSDGTNVKNWPLYATGGGYSSGFNYSFVRDVSTGSGDTTNKVIGPGDVVEFVVTLPGGSPLAPRASATLTLTPEVGAPVLQDFTTPATYGSSEFIPLI
ncbi:MAG: hypothetical protein ACYDCK_13305 [Thermoplasmatota archaeon]